MTGLALLAGCSSGTIVFELPELADDILAFMIVVERADVVVETIALDAADRTQRGPQALSDLADEETVALTVVGYAEPLDPLGLASGPGPVAGGRALGTVRSQRAVTRAIVDLTGRSPWEPLDLIPPELATVLVPATTGCRRLTIESLKPLAQSAAFIVPMGGRSLIGAEGNRLIPIPPIGTSTDITPDRAWLPAGETEFPTYGAFPIADRPNELWLAARDGKLWHVAFDADGRPERVIDRVASTCTDAIRWMAGEATRARTRIGFVGLDGCTGTFDGTRFEMFQTYADAEGRNWVGGAAMDEESGAIVVGRNLSREVTIFPRDGAPSRVSISSEPTGVDTVRYLPGVGLLVADATGLLFRFEGRRFEQFADTEIALGAEAIVPVPGGFLVGGNYGALREWRESGGFCPPHDPLALQTQRWWSPIEDGWLVSGPDPGINTGVVPLSIVRY